MASNKIEDITKLGPQGYRELQAQNNSTNEPADWLSALKSGVESISPDVSLHSPYAHAETDIDSGQEWGSSIYDSPSANEYEYQNLGDVRANNQSAFAKIGAGIGKMAVLATTTFVDGVAGIFTGMANVGIQAAQGNINSGKDAWNAFIDNPFSVAMTEINDSFEKLLPNYYTQAELESPWYTQLGTANFWGDKFLKNLGFTIGAAYSGKLVTGALSKAMGLKKVRDAFKGPVMTQSGKQLTKMDDIYKAYLSGDAYIDGVKITDALGKAAKRLKQAEMQLKIIGGVTAAVGEGRIEAINGTKEWTETHQKYVEDANRQDMDALNEEVLSKFPGDFSMSYDEEGKLTAIPLNQEAASYLESRKNELDEKKTKALDKIANDRGEMMNRIFGLNVALLSVTNLWTLGRFFSGGYTSARNAKSLVKGGLRDWLTNGGAEINKAEARKAIAKGLSNIPMEAQEEMSQAWIQETPGLKYGSELNNFYGRQIDPDAEEKTVDWMNATYKGFQNTYGDINAWEEGFIGGLTGLLGVPSISLNRNAQGKLRPKIGLQGELWENIKDARRISKEARYFVNEINKRIQTPEFQNYYRGAISHRKFDDEMSHDADVGDAFNYKNNEHNQLVSDAMMFDKAGRLQDFLDMIEEAGTITAEDAQTVREQSINKETGKSIFEDKSDQEIVDYFAKEKKSITDKVNRYVEISNNLKTLYGENINQDVLEELTWRMTVIDDLEARGKLLAEEIRELVKGKVAELGVEEVGRDNNQEIDELLGNFAKIEEAMNADKNLIDDINAIIADRNAPIEEQRQRILDRIRETNIELNDAVLGFGRKVRANKIAFKKNADRLARSRKRALDRYKKEQQENQRVEDIRDAEISEYEDYVLERAMFIEDLEKQRDELLATINRGGSRHASRVNSLVATMNSNIQALKNDLANEDEQDNIRDSFENKLRSIQVNLWAMMSLAYSDVISDNRLTTGQLESANAQNMRARAEFEESKREITGKLAALTEMLHARESQLLNPIDVKQASEKVIDLIKVIAYRSRFLNMYKTLSEHPEQFDSEIQRTVQEAKDRYADKQSDKILKKLGKDEGIRNIKELKEILAEEPKEVKDKVLKKLSESEEESIKKLGEELTKIEEEKERYVNHFEEKLSKENSPELVSAMNIIKDALDNSNSLEEAHNVIKEAIDSMPEEVSSLLQEAMDKTAKRKKSSKLLDEDPHKPKKPVKKKKKRKSLLDDDAYTEEEADESAKKEKESEEEPEEKEEEEEKEPKSKKAKRKEEKKKDKKERAKKLKLRAAPKVERNKKKDKEENAFTPEEKRSLMVAIENATTLDEVKSVFNELEGKSGKDVDELVDAMIAKMEELQNEASPEDAEAAELIRKSIESLGEGIADALGDKEEMAHQNAISDLSHRKADILNDIVELELRGTAEEVLDQYIEIFNESDNKDKDYYINMLEAIKKHEDTLKTFRKINDKAQEILDRMDNTASEDSEDSNEDLEKESDRKSERQPTLRGILRSWVFTQYDFNHLKSSERKAVPFNSPLLTPLRKLGAFEFVDNGSLGVLFNDNEEIPIHFIITEGDDALDDYVLLAVEVTKETEKIAKAINPITAHNGKKYQVVGVMGFDRNDSASMDNYNQMKDSFHEELDDVDGKYKVSENTTIINHLYSGRMVKSDESNEVESRPLKQVLKGEKPHFGIYFSDTDFRTPTLGDDAEVVRLNSHNTNPREGSIWLMTREADGRWYPKSVKIKRFTAEEFDIDENIDTPVMQAILEQLRIIADPKKSEYDRTIAKYELGKYLYFPKDKNGKDSIPILFKDDVVSISGVGNNIGKGLNAEEKAFELAYALQDESLNLRFQINMKELEEEDEDYLDYLLNSNIITTDLLIPHNVNASFDIYPLDSDGNIIEPAEDGEDKTGHTGSKKINNSLSRTTVYKDGEEYYISTKTDKVMYGDEEVDQDTADEVRFINQINQGIVAPVEGNNKLYLGSYMDGREFGVMNGHIIKGERLEELLDKAKNKNKRRRLPMPDRKKTSEKSPVEFGKGRPVSDDLLNDDEDDDIEDEAPEKGRKKQSIFDKLQEGRELGRPVSDDMLNDDEEDEDTDIDTEEEDRIVEKVGKKSSINPTTQKKASTISSNSKTTKESLNETLNRMARNSEESSNTIQSFVNSREGRQIMRELDFRNFDEFRAYCEGHPDKIPNFETVKSKEDFDNLIDEVRCTISGK